MFTPSQKVQKQLDNLPDSSGCYIYRDKSEKILYVGKARVLKNRVKSYFADYEKLEPKRQLLVDNIADIEIIPTDSELEALLLETNLIKKYRPWYNKLMKDDKNYIWLMIDAKEDFPKITIVREKLRKDVTYLGPYPSTLPVRRILRTLRRVFPYRTCNRRIEQVSGSPDIKIDSSDPKPCLYYYLGLCQAPCAGLVDKQVYRKNITKIKQFFSEKHSMVIQELESEMKQLAGEHLFEEAAKVRDKLGDLKFISQRITIDSGIDEKLFKEEKSKRSQVGLTELLDKLKPYIFEDRELFKIECYDISNIQGTNAVASMVVFVNGLPAKNLYRKFKIETKSTPDDFAMMQETFSRRFRKDNLDGNDESFSRLPDLIIVDGGKGQLSSTYKVLSQLKLDIPIVGLAKRFEEIFMVEDINGELSFSKRTLRHGSESRFLVQRIRDEAHRFGLKYHRTLRLYAQKKSVLDDIPGIGELTKRKLLQAFGSTEGIKKAKDVEIYEIIKNKRTVENLRKLLV